MAHDLVLSSGFLAFARHIGVLKALESANFKVGALCGTSSGALVGALWAAGVPIPEIAERLSAQTPLSMMHLHPHMWRGLFSMGAVIQELTAWLPARFEDLEIPFAVGVVDPGGKATLLTKGPLPQAVAASCAIPYVFAPVVIDGVAYRDGGVVDRTGIQGWRAIRGVRPTVLHLVDRSGGGHTDVKNIPLDVCRIHTPRSGARFWNLGDFGAQLEEARVIASGVVAGMGG